MHKSNVFAIVLALVLACMFVVPVFAEEVQGPMPGTSEAWATEVMNTIENHKHGDVNIIYATDSVLSSGVYADSAIDLLSKQVLFVIDVDLPAGYVVYDDPSTEYIDGIRLNGNTVNSYRVPIDYAQDVDFELIVKVVYAEGITGTLAQMSDGTYNWLQLLENPIGLLMGLYYVLATLSVFVSLIMVLKGKGKKAKTADEIAVAVTNAAETAAVNAVEQQVLPIVSSFQNTAQAIVKAYALTTSKSKEAPLALLDVLQEVSNTDATAAIEHAKQLIEQSRNLAETSRQETIDKLNSIAHTSQEVVSDGTEQSQETSEEDLAIF